jgi:hypothetical protein
MLVIAAVNPHNIVALLAASKFDLCQHRRAIFWQAIGCGAGVTPRTESRF